MDQNNPYSFVLLFLGLIPATSGTVVMNGYDITKHPDQARESLGLCPQQDLLFRDLTVSQTLVFFAMVRHISTCSCGQSGNLSYISIYNVHG